jgi:hypothetical protein
MISPLYLRNTTVYFWNVGLGRSCLGAGNSRSTEAGALRLVFPPSLLTVASAMMVLPPVSPRSARLLCSSYFGSPSIDSVERLLWRGGVDC